MIGLISQAMIMIMRYDRALFLPTIASICLLSSTQNCIFPCKTKTECANNGRFPFSIWTNYDIESWTSNFRCLYWYNLCDLFYFYSNHSIFCFPMTVNEVLYSIWFCCQYSLHNKAMFAQVQKTIVLVYYRTIHYVC